MPVHFETLWERAELLTGKLQLDGLTSREKIVEILQSSEVLGAEDVGEILLHICNLSRISNVNTYVALRDAMQSAQVSHLDP